MSCLSDTKFLEVGSNSESPFRLLIKIVRLKREREGGREGEEEEKRSQEERRCEGGKEGGRVRRTEGKGKAAGRKGRGEVPFWRYVTCASCRSPLCTPWLG